MIDEQKGKNNQNIFQEYSKSLTAFISMKKGENKNNLYKLLEEASNSLKRTKTPANIARSAIIEFILKYTKSLRKNNIINKLIGIFPKCFPKEDVVEISLSKIDEELNELSPLKAMVSFGKDISKNKKYLELCFKLILLEQNIGSLIDGINTLLNIKNKVVESQLKKLDFENPYSIILMRELINKMIEESKEKNPELLLSGVIEYINRNYLFFCNICFDILYYNNYANTHMIYCKKDEVIFTLKDKSELENLQNNLKSKMKCENCKKNIEIFEKNFNCIKCNNFYCQRCSDLHTKKDINNILINIYELGYICREHCKLYTTYCKICGLNICDICKDIHEHKLDKIALKLNNKLLEKNASKKLNDIKDINEYLLARLSLIYKDMNNFSYMNFTIIAAIFFGEKKNRVYENNVEDFYFAKFFDCDFQKYYSNLIKYVSEGKSKYYKLLNLIKIRYEESKKLVASSFDEFKLNYKDKKNDLNSIINNYIFNMREKLVMMDNNDTILKRDNKNIELNNTCLKLKNNIELLSIKIMALFKSKELYSSYLMKIINRYLVDFLLRKIIEKYYSYFYDIQISYKNFMEIVENFGDLTFKNKYIAHFKDVEKNLKEYNSKDEKDKKSKEKIDDEKIISLINNLKGNNKFVFKKDLEIKGKKFSAKEMNFILEALFYLKDPGNIIAHMNLKPKESIKLKKIEKDIPNIFTFNDKNNEIAKSNFNLNSISNDNSINTNSNIIKSDSEINGKSIDKNDLSSVISTKENTKIIISNIKEMQDDWLQIKDEIIKESKNMMNEIKEQILSDFYDSSINQNVKINDILNFIFNNDYSNLFNESSMLTRTLSKYIDDMIQDKNINIHFTEFDEIRNQVLRAHNTIKSIDENIELKKFVKDLRTELPEKIFLQTKKYIKNYIENLYLNNSKNGMIYLQRSFSDIINDLTDKNISFPYLDINEKNLLIISLIMQEIKSIVSKNLDIFLSYSKNSIKSYYALNHVKKILENLHNEIKLQIDIESNKVLFMDMKKYISNKNTSNNIEVDITYERMIQILSTLFEKENIDWTKLSYSKISLESLLFYYQNKKS